MFRHDAPHPLSVVPYPTIPCFSTSSWLTRDTLLENWKRVFVEICFAGLLRGVASDILFWCSWRKQSAGSVWKWTSEDDVKLMMLFLQEDDLRRRSWWTDRVIFCWSEMKVDRQNYRYALQVKVHLWASLFVFLGRCKYSLVNAVFVNNTLYTFIMSGLHADVALQYLRTWQFSQIVKAEPSK